mgnify:CR=1 FL=1
MSTGFKTTRTTNGLNPTYVVNGMRIEDDPGMAPKKLIRERKGRNDFHNPADIEGANSSYKFRKLKNRRTFRNPVDIGDITGAQADTVVNQLRTKRVTNPNNPLYTSLCGSGLGSITKPNTPDPRNSSFFASLDADGDGTVTYSELLQAADHNKDGNLTVAELHKFAKGKITDKELTRLMRQVDQNNDGVISANEGGTLGNALVSEPPATASSSRSANQNDEADEIDRLRKELEMLRREAKVLSKPPPSQSSSTRAAPPSSSRRNTGSKSRQATSSSRARATPPRSAVSTGSRTKESMRARRERIATAEDINAVRNLP